MKRLTLTLFSSAVLIALIFGNFQMAWAADDVENTKHNINDLLDPVIPQYGSAQICVFCHTPHSANDGVKAPLWNRNVTTSGYTAYDSPTIDMDVKGTPTGVSLACLSCHDGQIGLDVILNMPGTTGDTVTSRTTTIGTNTMVAGADADYDPLLTQDLSDDHPVSVTYDNTSSGDLAFNSIASAELLGLRFFDDVSVGVNNVVQCATCHNPHMSPTSGNEKFLRIANAGSALCKTCHIK